MKSSQRRAASAAGFFALSLASAPLIAQPAQPQRGGVPKSDTPYILVTTFHSSDRKLGVEMGDELRKRFASEHSAQELYVIPKMSINNTLEASGYRPDSALGPSDLIELSKGLRGEMAVEGWIEKAGNGVRASARVLMRAGQSQIVAQPLPPIDAKDVGDAVKQIEKQVTESNKALPQYKTCKNSVLAAKYPEAVAAARASLAAYPSSTFARLCLLTAFNSMKAPADSIIVVAAAVRAADSTSMIALASLAEAYMAKGDTAKAIETNLAIYRLDPTNTSIASSIVQTLAQSGAPDKALPIIDSLLIQNPGDVPMLKTKWLLLLRAGQYKKAIAAGEDYVKADTSQATLDYFQRQIGTAQTDSNAAAVQQLASKAGQKFPRETSFPLLLAQGYFKAGQLQQALASARRAQEIDPKAPSTWLFVLAIQNQLNQTDSMVVTAQKAIAAGVPKDSIGASLAAVAAQAFKKAQDSKAREDYEAALKAAQTVDAIAPSAQSKFYIGVSSFSIGGDGLTNVQKLQKAGKKEDKLAACAELKVVEDMFAIAGTNMPAGGRVDPATAATILNGITQYSEYIPQFRKALACK